MSSAKGAPNQPAKQLWHLSGMPDSGAVKALWSLSYKGFS